jgi:P27 family predicted phage terminase small subunit
MKGRKPTLQIVKEAEGNRSHAAKTDRAPRVEGIGLLEPPDRLTPAEKGLWDHLCSCLPPGVLARADTSMMERFVVSWARWRECDDAVKADGLMVITANGAVRHPLLPLMTALGREMSQSGAEMGLSPVARQRLMAGKVEPDDEMSWLMGTG